MPVLRLTQSVEGPDQYRAEIALEGEGLARQTATARFRFALTLQDREDVRWYLEDYLDNPHEPAPTIAARIEARMADLGMELFRAIFHGDEDARDLWATLRVHLNDTRVEVVTGVREAVLPWELLRDPKTDTPLALRARAFVHAHTQPAQRPKVLRQKPERVRILLVISRPKAGDDVPFRSVASRLVKSLGAIHEDAVDLDVLRPPSVEELARVLRAAKQEARPYHIVHFDGHGVYFEQPAPGAGGGGVGKALRSMSPYVLGRPRTGAHGYLVFENAGLEDNAELVDGSTLGRLLAETDVSVLLLNACRSAHAEAPPVPENVAQASDVHRQARAFGSLAQEVMDAGVGGVVAMRYNVYVVTAAQFVADLYSRLTAGDSVGEAVSLGRKQLADQPLRAIAYDAIPLQDWVVPVVYEAAPIALFPEPPRRDEHGAGLAITVRAGESTAASRALTATLPPPPDVGFFGRDETLLALDRAFDSQRVVLLHAYAGSGKTATASEFARWYALTGGVDGPVLFTSFEQYVPLRRVLDQLGRVFDGVMAAHGIQWLTLTDAMRRDVALQILAQVPMLWVWDNVESVAGFPEGAPSPWSRAEQQELADFLRATRGTKTRFLLTSRRKERGWLGELPRRVAVPPMPMQERVQLARAVAEKHGHRIADVEDWRPLLRFTEGNPLAITVLVGQALRSGIRTPEQVEQFVTELRAGAAQVDDDEREGRSRSLGASLGYGFERAFSEAERAQLALLHLFQSVVDVDALRFMGMPEADWCVPQVRGLTREQWIVLLDHAAEVGLLTARGGGYYDIHPALPWYFRRLFERYYGSADDGARDASTREDPAGRAARAYVDAVSVLAEYWRGRFEEGAREVVGMLAAEEANMLHARKIGRVHGQWSGVVAVMAALSQLYRDTGRSAEFERLVKELVPDFVDTVTDGPLAGREAQWEPITNFRVRLALDLHDWEEAERLQHMLIDRIRRNSTAALSALAATVDTPLDQDQRSTLSNLSSALFQLGQIRLGRGESDCVTPLEEAFVMAERSRDQGGAIAPALHLARAYMTIPALRDLDRAEQWLRRAYNLTSTENSLIRGKNEVFLGNIALERFTEALAAGRPIEELGRFLTTALQRFYAALELIPTSAVGDMAVIHNQLGTAHSYGENLDRGIEHFRQSIRYEEQQGHIFGAAQARYNTAIVLGQGGRFADALEYAHAALRDYEQYGEHVVAETGEVRELIARLKRAQAAGEPAG